MTSQHALPSFSPLCFHFRFCFRGHGGHWKRDLRTCQIPLHVLQLEGQIASENWQVGEISVKHRREITRENCEVKKKEKKKNTRWSLSFHSRPLVNFICEWFGVNDNDSFLIVSYSRPSSIASSSSRLFCGWLAVWQWLLDCSHANCHLRCDGHVQWLLVLAVWFMIQLLVTVRSIYTVKERKKDWTCQTKLCTGFFFFCFFWVWQCASTRKYTI